MHSTHRRTPLCSWWHSHVAPHVLCIGLRGNVTLPFARYPLHFRGTARVRFWIDPTRDRNPTNIHSSTSFAGCSPLRRKSAAYAAEFCRTWSNATIPRSGCCRGLRLRGSATTHAIRESEVSASTGEAAATYDASFAKYVRAVVAEDDWNITSERVLFDRPFRLLSVFVLLQRTIAADLQTTRMSTKTIVMCVGVALTAHQRQTVPLAEFTRSVHFLPAKRSDGDILVFTLVSFTHDVSAR